MISRIRGTTGADEALLGAEHGHAATELGGAELRSVVGGDGLKLPPGRGQIAGHAADQRAAVRGGGAAARANRRRRWRKSRSSLVMRAVLPRCGQRPEGCAAFSLLGSAPKLSGRLVGSSA